MNEQDKLQIMLLNELIYLNKDDKERVEQLRGELNELIKKYIG